MFSRNGRDVKSLLATATKRATFRLRKEGGDPLDTELLERDFFEMPPKGAARAALVQLVNVDHILKRVMEMEKSILVRRAKGSFDPATVLKDMRWMNWTFVGSPGTGKTTVARAFGEVFHELGLLAERKIVEVSGLDLCATHTGQTSPLVRAKLDQALGGVLFINEAYGLLQSSFGTEAITTLLQAITTPKYEGKLVIVLDGYPDQIFKLLSSNSGYVVVCVCAWMCMRNYVMHHENCDGTDRLPVSCAYLCILFFCYPHISA